VCVKSNSIKLRIGICHVTYSAAMLKPSPEVTDLRLDFVDDRPGPLLPDSSLGGTAPRLRSLRLSDAPFLGSPKLFLCFLGPVSYDTSKRTNPAGDQ
jgi:hypothetical protein